MNTCWFYPALAVLSTLYFFWAYGRVLEDPNSINDDVVQHFLWMLDTSAWSDDFLARASYVIQPWGYRAMLSLLSEFFAPIPISRYGPLPIVWLNAGFGAGILRKYYHPVYAMVGGLLVAHLAIGPTMGFNARAFSVPLLTAFGYFLVRTNSYWQLGATLVASALFYPPSMLVNIGVGGLWLLYLTVRKWRLPLETWPAVAGAAAGLLIAFLQARSIAAYPGLGEMFSWDELLSMNEFRSGGRVDFRSLAEVDSFYFFRYFMRAFLELGKGQWFSYLIVGSSLLVGLVQRARTAALGGWLLAFGAATTIIYQVAKVNMPLLFLPDRYVNYPWRVYAAMLLMFALGSFLIRWPKIWLAIPFALLLAAYGFSYTQPYQVGKIQKRWLEESYAHIDSLPDSVLLAGPPQTMSHFMIYTERQVLITHEAAHALYFRNYYDYVTPRLHDQMVAYAAPADSMSLVLDFVRKYGVDHLLVQPDALVKGDALAFNPHQKWFREQTEGRVAEDFALLTIPDSLRTTVDNDRLFWVNTEDLTKWAAKE